MSCHQYYHLVVFMSLVMMRKHLSKFLFWYRGICPCDLSHHYQRHLCFSNTFCIMFLELELRVTLIVKKLRIKWLPMQQLIKTYSTPRWGDYSCIFSRSKRLSMLGCLNIHILQYSCLQSLHSMNIDHPYILDIFLIYYYSLLCPPLLPIRRKTLSNHSINICFAIDMAAIVFLWFLLLINLSVK